MLRFACALLLAGPALAQLFPHRPNPARARGAAGDLVEIEALVADSSGHIATDLKAADFSLVSEKPPAIESCVYVDTRDRRTLVFLVDDLALGAEEIGQVRDAIGKFIAGRPAGDRLAILRSGEGEGDLQQLTGDSEILGRALDQLAYNPRRAVYGAGPARQAAFASGALGTLRTALEALRHRSGRKSIVLFSPGLQEQGIKDLEDLADSARNAEVSVYGIDPGVWRATPVEPRAPSSGATPVEFTDFSMARLNDAAGIAGLAQRTGGELEMAAGAVDQALARALAGPDGYYRIAYREPDASVPAVLKLKRPGYGLMDDRRASAAEGGPDDPAVPRQGRDDLASSLSEVFSTGAIRLRLTPLFYRPKAGSAILTLIHFDARDLTFRRGLDGTYHGNVEVLAAAYGAGQRWLQHVGQEVDLAWTESQYREARQSGAVVRLDLPAPAGDLQIRVVVRDEATGRVGSASQWLVVPAVEKGGLAISGVPLFGPEEAGGKPADWKSDEMPGVRIFHAGHPIHYRFDLYNLTADREKGSRIELRLTLFRKGGTVVIERPVTIDFPPGEARPEGAGQIVFPAEAKPGTYAIQLTVTDVFAPAGTPHSATEYAELDLRP